MSVDPEQAREQAQRVLSEERFRPAGPGSRPRPFKGVLEHLGHWIGDVVGWIDPLLPGGRAVIWASLSVVLLVAAVGLTARVTSRLQLAQTAPRRHRAGTGEAAPPSPDMLERDAGAAEARGEHGAAVRLRYAAGLLRLDAAGRLPADPSLTTGQARRALASRRFDGLARTFEDVAYGEGDAGPADAAEAREGWDAVLRERAA